LYVFYKLFNMGVGSNLRKFRSKTKYSQRDIADFVGVDKNTYCNWENEISDVKSEFIPKLASILEVDINDLFQFDKKLEINFNKQIHKDSSINNSVVLVMPDKESVDRLVEVLRNKNF
jgi:transcriptional regulator with XRE-family HTH domain